MLQAIQDALPAYAKDLKLNLSSLINHHEHFTNQQFWGTMLSCAIASKNPFLLTAIEQQAKEQLSPEAYTASKSAAAIMAMNNIYYRFTHLISNLAYQKMSPNLRMSVMAEPGIDQLDFELFSLAVSAINGCGKCMDSHEYMLSSKGISKETIQLAIKTASVIHAVASVVGAEKLE